MLGIARPAAASDNEDRTRFSVVAIADLIALVGAALVLIGLFGTWIRAGLLGDTSRYQGWDLVGAAISVPLAALAVAAGVAIERARGGRGGGQIAVAVIGVAAVSLLGAIALLESTAASIPREWLPVSIRRASVDIGAGMGIWLSFGGAVTATCALAAGWRLRGGEPLDRPSRITVDRGQAVGVSLLALSAALAWLRYQPWVTGSAGGESLDVEGWSVPWCGPLSLVALLLIAVAGIVGLFQGGVASALLAALGGWAATFAAALVVIAASSLSESTVTRLAPGWADELAPRLDTALAPWGVFALGLVAAGAGASQIGWQRRS